MTEVHEHAWEGSPPQCAICGAWRALVMNDDLSRRLRSIASCLLQGHPVYQSDREAIEAAADRLEGLP